MADERIRRSGSKRDTDAALEAILREVERSPRRRSFLDDDDEPVRKTAETTAETRRDRAEDAPRRQRTAEQIESERRAAQSAANREAQAAAAAREAQAAAKQEAESHEAQAAESRETAAPQRRSMQDRPVLAGSAPRRNTQERAQNRPEGGRTERPAQQRQPARPPRPVHDEQPVQRRSNPQNDAQRSRQGAQGGRRPSGKAVRRRASRWRIGLLLYILFFFVVILFLMHRLWVRLKEYESSRPQYTIDGYVTHLPAGFYSDMIRQKVEELPVSDYETADTIAETLIIEAPDETKYTWSRNPQEYTDENPVYYVRCGNAAIASVTLERISGTEKFDYPIWRAKDPVSLIEVAEEPAYDVDITIPAGASVMINGQAVSLTKMDETDSHITLDDTALNFTEQPRAQHASVSGLYVAPEVRAFDATGNQLEAVAIPDSSNPHQVYIFEPKDEIAPDPALESRMEDLTKAYINYMINQNEATWDNLSIVEQYLITGSKAQTTLRSIVGDISWNNPYSERIDKVMEVGHFKMYSDTVCTCESHFELQLTKNVVNDYVGTVRWTMVKVGDTWKGVDFEVLQSADADSTAEPAAEEPAAEEPAAEQP